MAFVGARRTTTPPTNQAERLGRLAGLAVSVGANVQPGQLVVVSGLVENAPLAREIARVAYEAGVSLVEPRYLDRHFTRALVELGPESSLGASAPGEVASGGVTAAGSRSACEVTQF